LTPSELYLQSTDKQRILITGGGSKLVASIVAHVLQFHNRRFDAALNGSPVSIAEQSPVIIIESNSQLLDYKHHIIVLGSSASNETLSTIEQVANATPKGGTIIYPKSHPILNKIGSQERTDVQAISYEIYKHDTVEGKTVLVSSTKERVPVAFSGEAELMCVSAAKELLKKIGISSGQFYKAISAYKSA
jgi:UDP-N-acetylmuramate: L-alanyl-gamma-D-glutamyl-meso-diaminopimelate ligase